MRVKKTKRNAEFWRSGLDNNASFIMYYDRLCELSMSMFKWEGLPDEIDERFLELALFTDGYALFFKEEDIGYAALRCMIGGPFNVYNIPTRRTAYAANGFNAVRDNTDSVIIYNNMIHTNSLLDVEMFAKRLALLDRSIDVNTSAQRTPVLIRCDETERLSLKNLYMKYEGNEPFIFGDKALRKDSLEVLKTDAPYVADKLYSLKTQIWNEILTYLGISNINIQKKERLITDEVTRNQGGVVASRYSRLNARRQACEQINKMFGLNVRCDFREDFNLAEDVENETLEETRGDTE